MSAHFVYYPVVLCSPGVVLGSPDVVLDKSVSKF